MNCEFISWELHATLLILTVVGLVWFFSVFFFSILCHQNFGKEFEFGQKVWQKWANNS
jgi:hypothetical protein